MIAINLCVALLFGYYQINDTLKEMYELNEDDNDDDNDDNLYNTVDHKGDLLLE